MNWNSMVRLGGASAVYVALVGAYLAGFNALEFALYSAVLLALALVLHSADLSFSRHTAAPQRLSKLVPSLSESMAELHALQSDINELQAQFNAETSTQNQRYGSGGTAN